MRHANIQQLSDKKNIRKFTSIVSVETANMSQKGGHMFHGLAELFRPD